MRVRFKPNREQRLALRAQIARLQQPAEVLALLRAVLPAHFTPNNAATSVESVHPDRFVLRVRLHSDAGEERAYALKTYSDNFAERVWAHAQSLAAYNPPDGDGLCLPMTYLPHERTLVFPWVNGMFLSEIVDERKVDLLRRAACIAAKLHRSPLAPEKPTTPQMLVQEASERSARLRDRWPATASIIEPLVDALKEAVFALDPAAPAPIHGDMAAGQFLWTGERLVLLDLDMFGYTDPAYDAGHFLAQLERRCLLDLTVRAHARLWFSAFHGAYLAAMPNVSARNVSFYRGLTLIRKIYTLCRRQPVDGPALAPQLAARARAALQEVIASQPSHEPVSSHA